MKHFHKCFLGFSAFPVSASVILPFLLPYLHIWQMPDHRRTSSSMYLPSSFDPLCPLWAAELVPVMGNDGVRHYFLIRVGVIKVSREAREEKHETESRISAKANREL